MGSDVEEARKALMDWMESVAPDGDSLGVGLIAMARFEAEAKREVGWYPPRRRLRAFVGEG